MDIARASHACFRCRRQKKKCNRAIPKCSHCLRANVACSREALINGSHAAVRTVAELEAEVARLEAQVATGTEHGQLEHLSIQIENRHDVSELGPEPTPSLGVLADLNNATVYDYENYNLMRMLTHALMLGNNTLDAHPTERLDKSLSLFKSPSDNRNPINRLPKDLIAWYLDRYLEHVNPTFPILDAQNLRTTLQCLSNEQPADPSEECLLYLALAIGAIFPSTDSLLDANAACQLWTAASKMQVSDDESENTIHILILLALFSLLEDGAGSSWHLVELAVRSCIKLGLHSQATEQTSSVELFWSAYLLDRWVSCTLGLSVSINNQDFDQRIPDLPAENDRQLSPISLWRMAYGLYGENEEFTESSQEQTWLSGRVASQSASLQPSELLHSMIATDLRIAHASRCVIRQGEMAAQRFNNIATDHLSLVEIAVKHGHTLPWTAGYTTFVSIMIQLISFGQLSKCRLLFATNVIDPTCVIRALDVLRLLGRKFKFLDCLVDILNHLNQFGTATAPNSTEYTTSFPRHSGIYTITSCALQSIGISWSNASGIVVPQ